MTAPIENKLTPTIGLKPIQRTFKEIGIKPDPALSEANDELGQFIPSDAVVAMANRAKVANSKIQEAYATGEDIEFHQETVEKLVSETLETGMLASELISEDGKLISNNLTKAVLVKLAEDESLDKQAYGREGAIAKEDSPAAKVANIVMRSVDIDEERNQSTWANENYHENCYFGHHTDPHKEQRYEVFNKFYMSKDSFAQELHSLIESPLRDERKKEISREILKEFFSKPAFYLAQAASENLGSEKNAGLFITFANNLMG